MRLRSMPVVSLGEQRVPARTPEHLDDVPARAAEIGLEFLNDLAVAAHRPIEPLQVAVDDEDQVVELLAAGERDRAERFRLVHLAVAQKAQTLRGSVSARPRPSQIRRKRA